MIRYPMFHAVVAGMEPPQVTALAVRAGVPVDGIRAIAAGDLAAGLAEQMRLGRALATNPLLLFALDPDLEGAMPANRYVSDPATLATVDR